MQNVNIDTSCVDLRCKKKVPSLSFAFTTHDSEKYVQCVNRDVPVFKHVEFSESIACRAPKHQNCNSKQKKTMYETRDEYYYAFYFSLFNSLQL